MNGYPDQINAFCIPRVDAALSKHFIFCTFCNLKIGFIENIYEIQFDDRRQETGPSHPQLYKRVIVRVKWNAGPNAEYMLGRLREGKSVKVVYSMPWYWICLPNRPLIRLTDEPKYEIERLPRESVLAEN